MKCFSKPAAVKDDVQCKQRKLLSSTLPSSSPSSSLSSSSVRDDARCKEREERFVSNAKERVSNCCVNDEIDYDIDHDHDRVEHVDHDENLQDCDVKVRRIY